jgi:hypothetical protein
MPIGHTVATGNPYAQTGGTGALMAAQNVPICTVDVLTGIGSMSVQNGGSASAYPDVLRHSA